MKKLNIGWRNSFRIRVPVCDNDQFDDWEAEESKLRKELFEKERADAVCRPTHRIDAIANSHDYNCRCGYCVEHLIRMK